MLVFFSVGQSGRIMVKIKLMEVAGEGVKGQYSETIGNRKFEQQKPRGT